MSMKRALTRGSVSGLLFLTSVGVMSTIAAPPPPVKPDPPAGANVITKHDPVTMRVTIEWSPFDPPSEVSRWMSASLNSRDVLRGTLITPLLMSALNSQVEPGTIEFAARAGREAVPVDVSHEIDSIRKAAEYRVAIPPAPAMNLAFGLTFEATLWNITFDEKAAQRATWPRQWPDEAFAGLGVQFGIDEEHEIFHRAVREVTGGRERTVAPHLVAKELLRYAVNHVRITNPRYARMKPRPVDDEQDDPLVSQMRDEIEFIDDPIEAQQFYGSVIAASIGFGSRADLVAVCVATLRAAGIPARPVMGLERRGTNGRFIVWGEYYLNQVGWVPFDPAILQSERLRLGGVNEPYPGVGGIPGMNQRLPLAYSFVPTTVPSFNLVPPPDPLQLERDRNGGHPDRLLTPDRRVETRARTFNQSRRFLTGFTMLAELNGKSLSPTFAHLYPKLDVRFQAADRP